MADATRKTGQRVVVALGGNAILQPGQVGTFEEQLFNIDGEAGTRIVPDAAAKKAPAPKGAAGPKTRAAKTGASRRTAAAGKADKPGPAKAKPRGADVIDIHEARRASRGATS